MNNKRLVTWKTDWHKHIEKTPDQINKVNIKMEKSKNESTQNSTLHFKPNMFFEDFFRG